MVSTPRTFGITHVLLVLIHFGSCAKEGLPERLIRGVHFGVVYFPEDFAGIVVHIANHGSCHCYLRERSKLREIENKILTGLFDQVKSNSYFLFCFRTSSMWKYSYKHGFGPKTAKSGDSE